MILVLGALLLWAAPAHAVIVAIVTPPRATPEWTEMLSRLRGELLSVGFEVRMVHRGEERGPNGSDSRAWLEELAAEGGIDAAIDIVGDIAPVAVDIWVIEQSPPRLEVSRVVRESDTTNASARLAIRAVEVLRSTFLENDMARNERLDESVATVPEDERDKLDEPSRRRERFGVELGVAALTGVDGVGPSLMPTAQLGWKPRPWLVVHAAVAGLGSRPTVATTVGHARVAQQYGVLGVGHPFRSDRRMWPFVTLGAGVLRTSVEGEADSPRRGHTVQEWSFLLDAGSGAGLRLSEPYTLTLTAHVQMADPYVVIHFEDAVVATAGRPNLALVLTIGAWP
jgi:hypothetical protein